MKWQIEFKETALKDIQKLNPAVRRRIGSKIRYFMTRPNTLMFAVRLADSKTSQYRWRVGNYRVLFDVHDKIITVLVVEHRREVYRK